MNKVELKSISRARKDYQCDYHFICDGIDRGVIDCVKDCPNCRHYEKNNPGIIKKGNLYNRITHIVNDENEGIMFHHYKVCTDCMPIKY